MYGRDMQVFCLGLKKASYFEYRMPCFSLWPSQASFFFPPDGYAIKHNTRAYNMPWESTKYKPKNGRCTMSMPPSFGVLGGGCGVVNLSLSQTSTGTPLPNPDLFLSQNEPRITIGISAIIGILVTVQESF